MRKALGRRRDVVYTYSNDFMSLNVSMVDEFRIRQVRKPEPNNMPGCFPPVDHAPRCHSLKRHVCVGGGGAQPGQVEDRERIPLPRASAAVGAASAPQEAVAVAHRHPQGGA
jgi:hypothetical protein